MVNHKKRQMLVRKKKRNQIQRKQKLKNYSLVARRVANQKKKPNPKKAEVKEPKPGGKDNCKTKEKDRCR